MAVERTLCIIKPDAVEKNTIGGIVAMIEAAGLKVKAMRMQHFRGRGRGLLRGAQGAPVLRRAGRVHDPQPVVFVMCLEGEDAIAKYREVMGATDPAKAAPNTIRKKYGANIGENACHGSDATETAALRDRLLLRGLRAGLNRQQLKRRAARACASSWPDLAPASRQSHRPSRAGAGRSSSARAWRCLRR